VQRLLRCLKLSDEVEVSILWLGCNSYSRTYILKSRKLGLKIVAELGLGDPGEGEMTERTEVQVAEIVDSRWQTRQDGYSGPKFDELVESVRHQGIVNPPGVFRNQAGEWELVYGHRRVAAARQAGCSLIPITRLDGGCQVTDTAAPILDRFQQMVIADNLYHEDLSPLELAEALHGLIEQQGLRQATVAEIYGKSQQWVSDKLRLLDLAPEVQEKLTARSVEESVARRLAQLPEAYQAAVAKHIEGRPSREAIGIMQEIEKAADPAFWDLPEDRPWTPELIKVQAMMYDCLEKVPQDKKGEVLVALSKAYMLQRPGGAGCWGMDRFAKACGLKRQNLAEWQAEHGRGCEQCLFAGEGLWRYCGEPDTKTCTHCLIAIDPVRLPYPDGEGKCTECVKEGHWCTDVTCYIETLKVVRGTTEQAAQEEDLEETVAMLEELRAFYDRQGTNEVECAHWLAQACEFCVEFRGSEHKEQCGVEGAKYVATAFWQSEEIVVPRCSAFGLKDASRIPEIDQGCFDEILLGWLGKIVAHGGLGDWLPGERGKARMEYLRSGVLNRKQLVALLTYVGNPVLTNWHPSDELMNPITGEKSTWTVMKEAEEEPALDSELQETGTPESG